MSNEALFRERSTRIERAMRCEPVDLIPVIYMGFAFAPRYMGMSMAKYCADAEAACDVTIAAMDRLGGPDGINSVAFSRITPGTSALWLSRVAVPGKDLPADSLWQVLEKEVMTPADYAFQGIRLAQWLKPLYRLIPWHPEISLCLSRI